MKNIYTNLDVNVITKSVLDFVRVHCKHIKGVCVSSGYVFTQYIQYCKQHGSEPAGFNYFLAEMSELGYPYNLNTNTINDIELFKAYQ